MSKLRKKRGRAFWATVVVVATPVFYVLSIGPAALLGDLIHNPNWYVNIYEFVYRPIIYFDDHGPRWLGHLFARYVYWCMGDFADEERLVGQWSRLIVGAVIVAAMLAFVVRAVNKMSVKSQTPTPDGPSESN